MNNKELLEKLLSDLQVCKPNKKEAINLIIKMLSKVNKVINTQYNLGCIAEACIKSHFSSDSVICSSPKGVNDLNIEISQYNIKKYFNGIQARDIDIKFINNYSSAHKPQNEKYLVCITPKGAYMIYSGIVEYNNDNKIILSSVYKNGVRMVALGKKLGLE